MGMSAYGEPNDDVVKLIKDYYKHLIIIHKNKIMRTTFNNTEIF